MKVTEKLELYNIWGQAIHPDVKFKNGFLGVQLAVGHPQEEGAIPGCYNTHLFKFCKELQEGYQSLVPSQQNLEIISHLEEILKLLDRRHSDRVERSVIHTDNS